MYGLRDLTALAEDDAAVEECIRQEDPAALAYLCDDWDARVEAMEERANVRALVFCAPIALIALAIIVAVWGA